MSVPHGVAVLGGVFAPPTRAHVALLLTAMRAMNAERGVFVPAGETYLSGARAAQRPAPAFADARTRLDMLRVAARIDPRLGVYDAELCADQPVYTLDTLRALAAQYGRARFVMGVDALRTLPRWHGAEEILSKYGVLVARRDCVGIEGNDEIGNALRASSFLRAHARGLTPFDLPEEARGVSASLARALILCGRLDEAEPLLPPGVMDVVRARVLPSFLALQPPDRLAYDQLRR